MKNIDSVSSFVAVATLVWGVLGTAATAHAGDVYWTVGVSSPGVQVGVSSGGRYGNYAPAYVQPYPVYVQSYPVYNQSYPVYETSNPVVYVRPETVYVRPTPVYGTQYQYAPVEWQRAGSGWRHGHRHHPHNQYNTGGYDRDGGYYRQGGHDGHHSGHRR